MKYPLAFYTSYSQFYICDKSSPGNTGSRDFWDQDSYDDRLAIDKGILGVGTECYGPIKGELELLKSPNNSINLNEYDHIVEGGIEIESGFIQVLACPTSSIELEIQVDSGFYRTRIYSSNLTSVDGDEGDDFYKIEIWPGSGMERNILKYYHGK
jgi:hypothetical protein